MKAFIRGFRGNRVLARRWVVSLFFLLTVAAAWLYAHPGHAPLPTKGVIVDVAKGQIILSKEARDALDVRTAEITNQPLAEKLLAYAVVVAPWQSHAYASSRLPGQIVALSSKPGQAVQAGDILAEVRSVELEALQLDVVNAKAECELSEKILKGYEESPEAIAAQQMWDARTKHQQNLNLLEIAKSKWRSLGLPSKSLDALLLAPLPSSEKAATLPIRSPISGTISHADLSIGRVVEASEHLFEIVDLTSVWVKIGVLEKDLARVQIGQHVEFQLTAYPGKVFKSTISFKGLYLDPQTHLNAAWAKVDNTEKEPVFLPGMAGQTQIVLPAASTAKTIPADALINDGVDTYVLVEEAKAIGKSEYRKRSVTVVRQTPVWFEVESADLLPGDHVVTQGSPELGGLLVPGVLKLTPQMERTIGMRVEPVKPQAVEDVAKMPGVVDVPPAERGFASAQLAGTIHKIRVEPGQEVVAGQVVAEIAGLELQNLQMDLLKEHLTYQLLRDQFSQLQIIKSALSKRTYLEVENSMFVSGNRRDSLLRRLELLGLSSDQLNLLLKDKKLAQTLPVRAPLTGVVCVFDKVLGQMVRAEEPLVEIHNLARPWIKGFVSELDLERVSINQPVRVRFVSDPRLTFAGKVVRSSKVFATESRSLSIWVELDEYPQMPLLHNQVATISLIVSRPAPSLAAPLQAIVREGTLAFVFVRQKDGAFDRRSVITGRADDQWITITSGLQVDEQIAVSGTAELQTAYASLR